MAIPWNRSAPESIPDSVSRGAWQNGPSGRTSLDTVVKSPVTATLQSARKLVLALSTSPWPAGRLPDTLTQPAMSKDSPETKCPPSCACYAPEMIHQLIGACVGQAGGAALRTFQRNLVCSVGDRSGRGHTPLMNDPSQGTRTEPPHKQSVTGVSGPNPCEKLSDHGGVPELLARKPSRNAASLFGLARKHADPIYLRFFLPSKGSNAIARRREFPGKPRARTKVLSILAGKPATRLTRYSPRTHSRRSALRACQQGF